MTIPLKCLLLDDELPGLAYLRMLCEQMQGVEVVRVFNDPLRLLEEINQLTFDCCILDIEMPQMNGLQLAQLLEGKEIIFTTAYREYAPEAFDLNAVDYVQKPIQRDRLEKALQRARERINRKMEKEFIVFNTDQGKANISPNEIVCITAGEIDRRDKQLFLNNSETIVLKNISFQELLKKLPANQFCRISKSAIIAIQRVRIFTQELVELSHEDPAKRIRLSIGDPFRMDFFRLMNR
ncbi:LytR/AlgR family response regulator transcription factor [Flavihumibacter sp. UBA7668]|uniref:LytR/AlgR family response regulator transcription factor n=1 Tax=Flavihumibacter sp. UBA7668 TaxID=1946542 RepID=UPI0025B8AEF7|nr:response regulator transcription factor [Flavihumibacter sp. UBA7668]